MYRTASHSGRLLQRVRQERNVAADELMLDPIWKEGSYVTPQVTLYVLKHMPSPFLTLPQDGGSVVVPEQAPLENVQLLDGEGTKEEVADEARTDDEVEPMLEESSLERNELVLDVVPVDEDTTVLNVVPTELEEEPSTETILEELSLEVEDELGAAEVTEALFDT